MAGMIANQVGKKMMKGKLKSHFSTDELYFYPIEKTDKRGNVTIQFKKGKGQDRFPMPSGLTQEERQVLLQAKKTAFKLDAKWDAHGLLGSRMGVSAVLGAIPAIGDVIDTGLCLVVLREIRKIEPPLPLAVQSQMLVRIAFQFAVGSIPLIGDYIDGVYKANSRNVLALQNELVRRVAKRMKAGNRPGDRFQDHYYDDDDFSADERDHEPSGRRWYQSRRDDRDTQQRRIDSAPPRYDDFTEERAPALPPRDGPEMRQNRQARRHY